MILLWRQGTQLASLFLHILLASVCVRICFVFLFMRVAAYLQAFELQNGGFNGVNKVVGLFLSFPVLLCFSSAFRLEKVWAGCGPQEGMGSQMLLRLATAACLEGSPGIVPSTGLEVLVTAAGFGASGLVEKPARWRCGSGGQRLPALQFPGAERRWFASVPEPASGQRWP